VLDSGTDSKVHTRWRMNRGDTGLRSGRVAELAGVSPDTIRHYEKVGILPRSPRTSSGYRIYGAGVVDRVRLVQRALQLGFTLAELSEILRVRDAGGVPCHRVLRLTEEKLRHLEQQIAEMRRTQRYMKQLVRQWRTKLSQTAPGSKALLLNSLVDGAPASKKTTRTFTRREGS